MTGDPTRASTCAGTGTATNLQRIVGVPVWSLQWLPSGGLELASACLSAAANWLSVNFDLRMEPSVGGESLLIAGSTPGGKDRYAACALVVPLARASSSRSMAAASYSEMPSDSLNVLSSDLSLAEIPPPPRASATDVS